MAEVDDVARTVLRKRYLERDERGRIQETPDELFWRVARAIAAPESRYGRDTDSMAEAVHARLAALEFLPNSPTLMNAGTTNPQIAACFVLPIEDSLDSIFTVLKETALIHQSGGGTGFSFSNLRPKGDRVGSTGGVASGPVSFMQVFDSATEQIKQGGRRRGANMAVLTVDHPDILEFIEAKSTGAILKNFNLSVGTTGRFWEAVSADSTIQLRNPRIDEPVDEIEAAEILDRIATMAWETGDPGILFLDTINEANPTPHLGRIEATNPCGEVPLLPYEACILGSVNLAAHTTGGSMDWDRLRETVRLGVRFLDNAITIGEFPVPAIDRMVTRTRKIGIGVMGVHDALIDLGIPYHSMEAFTIASEIMETIHDTAWETSHELATERNPFPEWPESTIETPVRNATTTAIAPTGSVSLIAGVTPGIEPMYGVAYRKNVMGGLDIVNDRFVEMAKNRGFYSRELLDDVFNRTTIQDREAIPSDCKPLFQTAYDIPPEHHVRMQAAFQRFVDNAVSKTVNIPHSATVDTVREIFSLARELDLKGITVFRTRPQREQVLGEPVRMEECLAECDYVGPEPS